ncbi:MAG: tryptophan 2,3-dioxygenase [Planctomycetota bacterium]|jgi:tryptophan 2,3-dioxygenase
MSEPKPTVYWEYLRLEQLLSLQGGLSGEGPDAAEELSNDEVLFITVHQIFELWFQLVLRELRSARNLFTGKLVAEQELSGAVERLRRVATIFRTGVSHFELVETLGCHEYLEFRRKLMPASGFQSDQLRRVEILFGLREEDRIPLGAPGSHLSALQGPGGKSTPAYERVQAQLKDTPTFKDAIDSWLLRTPIDGVAFDDPRAQERLDGFLESYLNCHAAEVGEDEAHALSVAGRGADGEHVHKLYEKERASVHAFLNPSVEEGGARTRRVRAAMLFIETYSDLPLLAWPRQILASLIEVEQSFLVFRQRHARMVERTIGRRTGTGGSAGVAYLDETALRYRIFRDLWAIRTVMVKQAASPELTNPEFYGFRSQD